MRIDIITPNGRIRPILGCALATILISAINMEIIRFFCSHIAVGVCYLPARYVIVMTFSQTAGATTGFVGG
jgi:hypothetical protein